MNFSTLCDFLDIVRTAKGVSEKSKLTKTFVKSLREQQQDLFCVLRLVVPKLDRDRPSYRLKESKIAKLVIKMLDLPNGGDKMVLQKGIVGTTVDFVDIIYSVLQKYIINKEIGLTISNINDFLDKIANRSNDSGLDDIVLQIFLKLSPRNIKWLIQIILKDLKLGFSENSILNCFHPNGADFFATNSNLKTFCDLISDPQVKLSEMEINIFQSFRPMLSKRCDASNFKKCFPESKSFIVENKFDGERFQLHMSEGQFKYFSRNGFDYTEIYGVSFNEGIFTPKLCNVFASETKRVILDGEMMLWNKETRNFGSKGMNFDVKKLGEDKKYQPCFCVFDILLHNDKILTNQPLFKRLNCLKSVVKNQVEGTIVLSQYAEVNSWDDLVNALNSSVDKNEEGIVVKDTKSVYKCSDRNSGWFKVKMEYFDDVVHDLDVILMGGSYSSGKLNSFFVGVSSGANTYLSFGRISSGLSDEQLDILNDKFKTKGIDFKSFSTKTEGKLHFGRDRPDLYIEPQNSCILQMRATELVRTTNDTVKCPYTLRFPRVLKIRDDKPVDECFSMNELLELAGQNKAIIKLNKRHIELSEICAKAKPAKKIKLEVLKSDLLSDSGDFLTGKRFYVDSGTQKWGLNDIYHSIKKAGGALSYRVEPNVDVIIVSKVSKKIAELMKQMNHFDIIHVDWLHRVMEYRQLVDYKPEEIFYKGTNFRRDVGSDLDKFGDSFIGKATKESLKCAFRLMQESGDFLNTNGAVICGDKPSFGEYIAYFDCFEEINNPDSKQIYYSLPDEAEFAFYNGTTVKEITSDVNLIVIAENNEERVSIISDFLSNEGFAMIDIVTKDFLYSRISSQK
ncbi:DNA ligase 4 [Tribolium madens]|uniref:DNA ligase 4 n=1 Tax=Tribolium madens TaxID=41895 RepID=UPI001CF76056|nr:DNA ligase 4 [Tribolium madens]